MCRAGELLIFRKIDKMRITNCVRLFFAVFLLIVCVHSKRSIDDHNYEKLAPQIMQMNENMSVLFEQLNILQTSQTNLEQQLKLLIEVVKNHLEDTLHIETDSTKQQQELNETHTSPKPELQNSTTKPPINFLPAHEYYKTVEPDYTWSLVDFKHRLNDTNNSRLLSPVFPLRAYPFGAQAQIVLASDNAVYISLSYKDHHLGQSESPLDFEAIPSAYYTLKDANRSVVREECFRFGAALVSDAFYYRQWILPIDLIADDNISIDIRVESRAAAERGYSFDGSMACVIDDFHRKRAMVKSGLFLQYTSPYFYTSPRGGYRVKALFRLNGRNENEDKGLSVEIHFLTGPYDANLTRSFPHTTTVTLLHPTDPSKRIVKSVDRDFYSSGGLYLIDMGLHAEIENVLDNDTLYCHVEIVPRSALATPAP